MKHLPAKSSIAPRVRGTFFTALATIFTLLGLALAAASLPVIMYAGQSVTAPSTVYAGGAGVFRSTDGGVTWTIVTSAFSGVQSLAVDPTNPSVIYAGVYAGVYKTTNAGVSWTLMNNGLAQASLVTTIVIDPSTPSTVYVGTGVFGPGGVYKSTDSGATWTPDNGSGATALKTSPGGILDVRALAIDPINTGTLYVTGVTGLTTSKTTDGGATWNPLANSVGFGFAAAVNPIITSTVYLAGPFGASMSTNAGTSWSPILSGLFVVSLAIDPTAPATVYAGTGGCNQSLTACSNTIYKTTNGGNFAVVGSLTSLPSASTDQVNALAVDPTNSPIVYAASGSGVYRSFNGGANWTLAYPTSNVTSLAIVRTRNVAPASITLGPNQSAAFPVVLPAPAGPGGVLVTLTSSDSNVALTSTGGSATSVEILPGETTPRRAALVYGVNFGSATVTATAPGFPSVTTNVLVTATLGFSPSSATVSLSRPIRVTLTLSAPAPHGGLTIQLTSDNPAVATVPATAFIAANATSTTVTLTPVGIGSTAIHASAPPNVPDTDLNVTVIH